MCYAEEGLQTGYIDPMRKLSDTPRTVINRQADNDDVNTEVVTPHRAQMSVHALHGAITEIVHLQIFG